MDEAEARRLISGGEGQQVEFKTSFAAQNEGIESLCAFTNADGGSVFFGVKDDGMVCGIQLGKKTREDFSHVLRTNSDPRLYPSLDKIQIDGRVVIAATIGKAALGEVSHVFGRAYIRVGAVNEHMSSQEQKKRLLGNEETELPEISVQEIADGKRAYLEVTNTGISRAEFSALATFTSGVTEPRDPYPVGWVGSNERDFAINPDGHERLFVADVAEGGAPRSEHRRDVPRLLTFRTTLSTAFTVRQALGTPAVVTLRVTCHPSVCRSFEQNYLVRAVQWDEGAAEPIIEFRRLN